MSDSLSPAAEARIRDSFARQTMMSTAGASLVAVRPGHVAIAAEVGAGFRQQQGFAHAALVFAIGDSAAGYAALTVLQDGVEVVTVEMKINLLAPASGRLLAEGRVLKAGRRLVVVAADVWAEAEGRRRQVAALQGTMIPVDA
jgi:uncharacterized protein (TIGR00369 family)